MRLKQLAADTRDPIATIVFGLLGIAGALGFIPPDTDPNTLAEIVGLGMGVVAAAFSFLHHKDFKRAIREGMSARENAAATPEALLDGEQTPAEGLAVDGE